MAQKSVTLNPGESTEVAFEVTPMVAKTYQVSVDGLYGSFVATTVPTPPEYYVVMISPVEGDEYDPYTPVLVRWTYGGTLEYSEGFRVDLAKPGESYKAISSPMWVPAFQYTIPGSYFDTPGIYKIRVVPGIGWSDEVSITVVGGAPPYCNWAAFNIAYGSKVGDPNYNPIFDFNGDGKIDFDDFVTFGDVCGEYL